MRGLKYDDEAKTTFLDELKVKTEINVSNDDTYNFGFEGIKLRKFYMDYGGSANHHLSRNTESVKNFFNYLADDRILDNKVVIVANQRKQIEGRPYCNC